MSSIVRTVTPFINREILLEALAAVGCNYTIQGNTVVTDRRDNRGLQKFELTGGRYKYVYYSGDQLAVGSFLKNVGEQYSKIYKRKLEELAEKERQRLEQERRDFVEKQRSAIVAKAKEQGYDVRETVVDNKIKLVLVQTTY
ncbi:MAG: hypothetical protein FWG66_12500 [Spirochaetes bacterium]|nr:hypothetical protein [Spirochaetota bacterium]